MQNAFGKSNPYEGESFMAKAAKKAEAAAEKPAKVKAERPYPALSANFMSPRATFPGRLKTVMRAFRDSGNDMNHPVVDQFRNALAAGDIPPPLERVSRQAAAQLASIAIKLDDSLLPEPKAAKEEEGDGAEVTAAV
jgi:hypothetical protein